MVLLRNITRNIYFISHSVLVVKKQKKIIALHLFYILLTFLLWILQRKSYSLTNPSSIFQLLPFSLSIFGTQLINWYKTHAKWNIYILNNGSLYWCIRNQTLTIYKTSQSIRIIIFIIVINSYSHNYQA